MMQKVLPKLTEAEVTLALKFAQGVLTEAGAIALGYFRQSISVDNKLGEGEFDPVTCADREVEAFLRQKLSRQFPEYGIIGEEGGVTTGSGDINWIIDPIDGTKAFISGFPTWGMLLGLQQGDEVLAGLMRQPATGELFIGSAAGGELQQQGQSTPLRTRPTRQLNEAILYCTHESMFANQANLEAFRRIAAKARLQRFGGDCYAYCMLALGQIDLVVEDTLQPYDIVPLIPIIEAAGGVITNQHGKTPLDGGFVIAAATKELHQQAMDLL
ncbi:MAG: histidinol-phosphatase [Desulfuromonadales bacterium]|nr:histidinol-phosphatase [Desulfuromonadales bacterium]